MKDYNVILITVDCLRYDRCGFNGHDRNTTPFLDKLAANSTVFDHAYASGPYTAESFPGILAGQHGFNGAYYSKAVFNALSDDSATIASMLADRGYKTVAAVSNPQLTEERNFDIGFDDYDNLRTSRGSSERSSDRDAGRVAEATTELKNLMREAARWESQELYRPLYISYRYRQSLSGWPTVHGEQIIKTLFDRISPALKRDEPIFAWTHLMDLHSPIHPDIGVDSGSKSIFTKLQRLNADSARWTNIESRHYDRLYDAALSYVDNQIADMVRELRELDTWKKTVLIITGDHGEALCDRGVYGHPYHYMFDDLLHVPFLIRTPDQGGRRINSLFSLAWLHELIADALSTERFKLPARSGHSSHLVPGMDSTIVVSDSLSDHGHTIAARTSKYKYIRHFGDHLYDQLPLLARIVNPYNEGVGYRINSDRGERHPLTVTNVPDDLLSVVTDNSSDVNEFQEVTGTISQQITQQLRDLGYTKE